VLWDRRMYQQVLEGRRGCETYVLDGPPMAISSAGAFLTGRSYRFDTACSRNEDRLLSLCFLEKLCVWDLLRLINILSIVVVVGGATAVAAACLLSTPYFLRSERLARLWLDASARRVKNHSQMMIQNSENNKTK